MSASGPETQSGVLLDLWLVRRVAYPTWIFSAWCPSTPLTDCATYLRDIVFSEPERSWSWSRDAEGKLDARRSISNAIYWVLHGQVSRSFHSGVAVLAPCTQRCVQLDQVAAEPSVMRFQQCAPHMHCVI